MGPFAIMINPKTLEIVQAFRAARSGADAGYRLGLLSDPQNLCIANCYTDGSEYIEIGGQRARGKPFIRVHSAGACAAGAVANDFHGVSPGYKGQGYGMLVYVAAAIGTGMSGRHAGVFSPRGGPNHNRSRDASKLWASMVDKEIAEEDTATVEGEEVEEEDDVEHCEDVSDSDYGDGWEIQDSRVCSQVTVKRTIPGEEEEIEVDLLYAVTVRELPFILWTSEGGNHELPPADLLVRARVEDQKTASQIANYLRKNYEDPRYVAAFADRPEVARLFGQQALLGPRASVGLPPVSKATRDLVDMFQDMP